MNKQHSNGRLARIPLTAMYQRTDRNGQVYLSGRIGLLRLLIFQTDQVSQGDRVWEAVVVESKHASEQERALAAAIDAEMQS